MASIIINGVTYSGNSVSVNNGNVIIDGKGVNVVSKNINISVNGDIKNLDVDSCNMLKVGGNVDWLNTVSGDVEVKGDIKNNVKTVSGDVFCMNIGGNVSTVSGDIDKRL